MISCRFNPNHKMKPSKLLPHEERCPDRRNKIFKTCPYNPLHKVGQENYDKHKRDCPDRPQVDENVEKELLDYLANMSSKIISPNHLTSEHKTPNTQVSIPTEEVSQIKNKMNKKEQQKKVLKMIDGWEHSDEVSEYSQSKLNFGPSEINDNHTNFNDLDSIFGNDNDLYEATIIRRNKTHVDFEQEDDDIFSHIYY